MVTLFPSGPAPFVVAHPKVLVRTSPEIPPKRRGPLARGNFCDGLVSIRYSGQVVLGEGTLGSWLRLAHADEVLFNEYHDVNGENQQVVAYDSAAPGSSWILMRGDEAGLPGVALVEPAVPATLLSDTPYEVHMKRLAVRVEYSLRAVCIPRGRPLSGPAVAKWLDRVGGTPTNRFGGEASPVCCSVLGGRARVEARRALGRRKHGSLLGPWSVFAVSDFELDEEVECCPLLMLNPGVRQSDMPGVTLIPCHAGGDRGAQCAIPLGFGALYRRPRDGPGNLAASIVDGGQGSPHKVLRLVAAKPIDWGEELFFSVDALAGYPSLLDVGWGAESGGLDRWRFPGSQARRGAGGDGVLRPRVRVAPSSKVPGGRGVFAARPFQSGDVLELAPCLTFTGPTAMGTGLEDYIMEGDHLRDAEQGGGATPGAPGADRAGAAGARKSTVLALGTGALYNHGKLRHGQNTFWRSSPDLELVKMSAVRDVAAGDELLISYTDSWWRLRGLEPS